MAPTKSLHILNGDVQGWDDTRFGIVIIGKSTHFSVSAVSVLSATKKIGDMPILKLTNQRSLESQESQLSRFGSISISVELNIGKSAKMWHRPVPSDMFLMTVWGNANLENFHFGCRNHSSIQNIQCFVGHGNSYPKFLNIPFLGNLSLRLFTSNMSNDYTNLQTVSVNQQQSQNKKMLISRD